MVPRSRLGQALVVLMLASCAGLPRPGTARAYADSPYTSSGAACAQNPVYCAIAAGAPESGSVTQAIGVGVSLGTVVAAGVLDAATEKKVEDVLKECADLARSDVLIRRFGGPSFRTSSSTRAILAMFRRCMTSNFRA